MLVTSDRGVPQQQVPMTAVPLQQWPAMGVSNLPQPTHWEIPASTMAIPHRSVSEEQQAIASASEIAIDVDNDDDYSEE
eukprot:3933162-Rhodomonas_salina.1